MMNAMGEITTDDEFAAHVDAFFDETVPRVLAEAGSGLERAKAWRRALHDAGLSGLDYPVAIGGQEASESRRRIYKERSAGRIPTEEGTFGIGIGMALPVVRDHGTDALKAAVVERGLRGDDIWCQLYSEPGAGSDLASLATKAERDGDEWVVTGQKVWTSGAQNADLAILLVRTDPEAPKHRGITMLVLPMNQDGVTVRPLRQMTGEAEFNEVFIDEARCPSEWVVGDVNDGWRMAVALLAHERVQTGVASTTGASGSRSKRGRVPVPVDDLIGLARSTDRVDDPLVRQELAALHTGEEIIRFLREQVAGGAAVLFSSHQLDLVERLCDELAIIVDGRIEAAGTVNDVRREAGYRQVTIEIDRPRRPLGDALDAFDVAAASTARATVTLADEARLPELLATAQAVGSVIRFDYDLPSLEERLTSLVTSPDPTDRTLVEVDR